MDWLANFLANHKDRYNGSLARAIVTELSVHLALFLCAIVSTVTLLVFTQQDYQIDENGTLFARVAILVAFGCLAGCTIIMVDIMRRMIVNPLREFIQAIEMIQNGAKDFPLPDARDDELGKLAMVFRSMISSIKERDRMLLEQNRSLEKRIESATADLRIALQESQRAQSILFGQHVILSRIATNAPLQESFEVIVTTFQNIVPQSLCAVLLLDSERQVLRVASAHGSISQFLQSIDGLPIGEEGGVCGLAAANAAFQSSSNLSREITNDQLRMAALASGIAAAWSQPILSRSGELLGTFNVFYSVAREPDAEEIKFADMLADLAGIAIERSRTERDLIKARDEAQYAARAKTDFLANMSHEIRTPMNGIVGLTDLALDLQLEGEARSYLEMIRESSQSLMEIINDILDFSKAEADRMQLEIDEIDLHRFIERTLAILSIRARQKSLVFVSLIEAHVPRFVRGDVTRIGQILNNLVTNAIKFTNREGAVLIYVDGEMGENNQLTLKCAVTDTGIGIPTEKQNIIFDVFTQADSSTTRRFGGTGLGLAICRQLVQLMGGSIWVRSKTSIGTAFHFQIQLERSTTDEKELNAQPTAIVLGETRVPKIELSKSAHSLDQHRVLVADDNPVNLILVTRILESLGVEIVGVGDGEAVLEEMQRSCFDLILMDLQMPKLDGFETTRAIRDAEQSDDRKIPIVALTASDSPGEHERCIEAGMDDFLQKPFRQADLAQKIYKYVYRP